MSFILDALKKSETDRQQQGSAELRPDTRGTVDIAAPAAEGPAVAENDFAEQLAVAKQNPPPRAEQQASVETPPPIETQTPVVTVASTPRSTTRSSGTSTNAST